MGRVYTKEQLDAINKSGENIIVSAGAGSGKTAVLTERVITKLKNGVHLNELLVLTFTNAAAFEMKERIRKSIKDIKELKEELDYLDLAYITTFDAFSLAMVKKYHYLLNVSPSVSIVEASIIDLKKREYLNSICERYYELHDHDFEKLISDFALKDDSDITTSILNIYNKLELLYDKKDFVDNYFNNYFTSEFLEKKVDEYLDLCDYKKEQLIRLLDDLERYIDSKDYQKFIDNLEIFNNISNKEDYFNINLSGIKIPNLPRGADDEAKNVRKEIKSVFDELVLLTKYNSKEEIISELLSTKEYVRAILKIINDLDKKINEYKSKYDLYDFIDIAKLAIKLVKEHSDIRLELQNTFHEILVDEYQDTSDLQEMFLSLLETNNLYMVGDMKQSIYRFRNANPKIFKNKYDLYGQNKGGLKIDLNKNFRSRNTVLDGINDIFDYIMDDYVGGANYKLEHRLVFGNTAYVKDGSTNQNMQLEILNYKKEKDNIFDTNTIEAFIMAHDIKEKVDNHFQVFDKDEGVLRDIKYSDFAVLVDGKKNFELYKKIFTYFNIPSAIHKEELLTDSKVITVIKNILILLTSTKMDSDALFSYVSIARSFLYPYSDETIMDHVTNHNFNQDLIMEHITNLKKYLSSITPSEMILKIIDEFSIYEKIITIGNVDSEIAKIEKIITLAQDMGKMGYNIYTFTDYLKDLKNENIEIKFNRTLSSSDAVKIMTIHKSKGLEFYICYFPSLSHRFNLKETTDKFTFTSNLGIVSPYYKDGIRKTIYPILLKEEYLKEEISEKLRVFYVALTRAKEKVIMIADLSKEKISKKENNLVSIENRMQYRSFLDILLSIKDEIDNFITPYDINKLNLSYDYQKNVNKLKVEIKNNSNIIKRELEYNSEVLENKSYSHKLNELIAYEKKMIIEAGNMLHYVLEVIDLNNPNLSTLPINDSVKEIIYKFLNNSIVDDISEAKIYQEYEFLYENDINTGHGIIDLLLVYDDKIKIIDYKLKNINPDYYEKQLLGYKEYLSNITNKPIELYLYSLLTGDVKKI